MNIINGIPMYYFEPSEFVRPAHDGGQPIDWCKRLDLRLLALVDSLRHQWGRSIYISRAAGTIGRLKGTSQHSIETDGICRALDIVPGIYSTQDAMNFVELSRKVGFTGIGCYPEWSQGCGFHVDTRVSHKPGNPSTWGMVGKTYTDLKTALHRVKPSIM